MNKLLFFDGKRQAIGLWNDDIDVCCAIVEAMKKDGWKVVWTQHYTDEVICHPNYKKEYEQWKTLSE